MMTEDDLDALFAIAKSSTPQPSSVLTQRVLADADAEMELYVKDAAPSRMPVRAGFWATLSAAFGGGGALAGMVTATVAGFYIGFAQPVDTALVTAVLGGDSAMIDLMPGLDALLDETP